MAIDRSDFLILATTLAAGGAGGWFYRDREPRPLAPPPVASAPPPVVSAPPAPSGPVPVKIVDSRLAESPACDDSQGTPEQCPSTGPADEGMCPDLIFKRCNDFKNAFKPRVATQAVACLRALKPQERCDPARINLCGHLALMAACPAPALPVKAQLEPSKSDSDDPATVTLAADPTLPPSPISIGCDSILSKCKSQPLGPTLTDCRQTLAGLNDLGRTNIIACASAHCTDRGLYACEALPKPASGVW